MKRENGLSRAENIDSGGVTSVIGVVMMVSITVVLASVTGTMTMGMANDLSKNAQAGVSFSQDGGEVTASLVSVQSGGEFELSTEDCSGGVEKKLEEIGEARTVSGCGSGDKLIVTGRNDGSKTLIQQYTVQ